MPYTSTSWEKLSIFLNFLVPKLPAPKEADLSAGLLETIDMESYRVEKRETMRIALADEEGSLDPVPAAGEGHQPDPELERLSDILRTFNDQFGNIDWTDADRVQRLITEDSPVASQPTMRTRTRSATATRRTPASNTTAPWGG